MRKLLAIAALLIAPAANAVAIGAPWPDEGGGGVSSCVAPLSCPGGTIITTTESEDTLLGRAVGTGTGPTTEIQIDSGWFQTDGGVLTISTTTQDNNFDGYIDIANYSFATTCVDSDDNGLCELTSSPGSDIMVIDLDEDGISEVTFTMSTLLGDGLQGRFSHGVGAGNAASTTSGNSSCMMRETATDRLYADRNCNSGTTRDTNSAGIERYLENDNEQARLTSDYTNATTTGTEVTGLQVSVNGARTYDITYNLLVQSSATGTGIAFGVNYTNGTPAPFICTREVPTDDVVGVAATGNEEDVHTGGTTGKTMEFWETQSETTTVPDMGPTAGFLTADAYVLEKIHCVITTASGAGDIELWAAAETANTIRVKAQSWVNVITVQ